MDKELDVERVFRVLDGDKDVLLIGQDSFTVSKLKELVGQQLRETFLAQTSKNSCFMGSIAQVSVGTEKLALDHITWVSIREVELLRIGSKGWEKGKIRINGSLKPNSYVSGYVTYYNGLAQVDIEFSPDEPPKPESPLDDLRELPEI